MELIASGVTDYVQVRQKVGLTAEELDDIIRNRDYYSNYFAEQDRLQELRESKEKKKPWWRK
jgi:hypothetical protein